MSPREPVLALLKEQRSHVLFVLSEARPGGEARYLDWYRGDYLRSVLGHADVLGVRQYEQHEIDITLGRYPRPPLQYLAIHDLCVDGAGGAESLIDTITEMHSRQHFAEMPATWLYYPANEKVGRAPAADPSLLTLAFANGLVNREQEFREWYATRHLRHALHIPALVSGQCFERTQFQKPGAMQASFSTIAIYEQDGSPEELLASFESIALSTFDFPALDVARFAESVYRPIQ